MSQEVTRIAPAPAALTVSEDEARAVQAAFAVNIASGSITEFDLPRIKPVNGEALWKIPTLEGHMTAQSIEGVIVFARDTRAYYPGKEIKNQPPDCSSLDGITGVAKAGVASGRRVREVPAGYSGIRRRTAAAPRAASNRSSCSCSAAVRCFWKWSACRRPA
jgi:hypothetical protein